jgi:hypothetical protein
MSDDAAVPVSVPAAPPAPADANPVPAAPPASAPYRSLEAAELPAPAASPKEWPVLGLSLWVFGVAMWAFVVMGELATSYGPDKQGFLVGEGTAALVVFGATVGAWGLGLRRSLVSSPTRTTSRAAGRAVAVAALAFLLWGFVTVLAAAFGESARANPDGKITVTLALLAGAAAVAGRRLAGLHRYVGSPRDRTVARVLWIGAALVSIVALGEVIAGD